MRRKAEAFVILEHLYRLNPLGVMPCGFESPQGIHHLPCYRGRADDSHPAATAEGWTR
jgi:hypothetical protein